MHHPEEMGVCCGHFVWQQAKNCRHLRTLRQFSHQDKDLDEWGGTAVECAVFAYCGGPPQHLDASVAGKHHHHLFRGPVYWPTIP